MAHTQSETPPTTSDELMTRQPRVWWSNALFFTGVHVLCIVGMYLKPVWDVPCATLLLCFASWQLGCFGITIGYHRMWSHRAFRGSLPVRVILAVMGSSATQGSIKWWCLRHRLHHRYTDDPVHDPYSATRGLWWSHMGWIFWKPNYERMELVDREDLDRDPVVRFQHKYYLPLVLGSAFVLPTVIAMAWNDPFGGYVYGALLARLMTWHCTFLVNSLAHYDGAQEYSDENTSRTNLIYAVLTCGEGNHNFHAFPQDFRAGPAVHDWDPSKWIILTLHHLGLVTGLRRAREADITDAISHMSAKGHHHHHHHGALVEDPVESWNGQVWDRQQVIEYVANAPKGSCFLLVDGFLIDATSYMGEHPGGALLLRNYSLRPSFDDPKAWRDATWAFDGGLNNHSRAATRRMRQLRIAQVTT